MHRITRIHNAPGNLPAFVAEVVPLFETLYGAAAASFYRQTAISGIKATITSPEVMAYACMDHDDAAAMLFVREEGTRKTINFFHVLLPYRGLSFESALLEFAFRDLGDWPGEIFTEFVPYHPMALDSIFNPLGFSRIERQIMNRQPWKAPLEVPEDISLRVSDKNSLPELAGLLVDVYDSHRERFLLPEVQSQESALTYLSRVQSGGLGIYRPAYGIGAWKSGRCEGFIIGSQILPGLGFTLHLAVRPEFRGRGLGRALLDTLAMAFAAERLDYIALGVTCDNSAVTLYERAGFMCVAQIPVYYRP